MLRKYSLSPKQIIAKNYFLLIVLMFFVIEGDAQTFIRSELPTQLTTPWEITYGPDNYLWITETDGVVSRVDPVSGNKTIVYTAPDYFPGSPLEDWPLCNQPSIRKGTLGLALHPDFINSVSSYIYFVYSYNSGTTAAPDTRFKLKRLKWDATAGTVVNDTDLVTLITNGYDHLGLRLMAVKQNNIPYLFLSVGDHGISEDNSPTCYNPQSSNPNNFVQDPNTQNGKIHRFNIDGTIPFDNPIAGNSFFSRGHRNPQGLMYNPNLDILYDVEHGDRTDDEINVLYKGMNYGWKNVRGYHGDNNTPGEAAFIAGYTPNPAIANDSLVEAFYSWCDTMPPASSFWLDWCTVAPSDGIYYGSTGIPAWTNSLLVVTLKDGVTTDRQLFQFKLQNNGELVPSVPGNPNPKKFFGADQALNGRLRDIAVSADGRSIFLINNGGAPTDKITVYTYDTTAVGLVESYILDDIEIYPNPVNEFLVLKLPVNTNLELQKTVVTNLFGQIVFETKKPLNEINTSAFKRGVYIIELTTNKGIWRRKFIKG
jgi:aldose sugar dehydrogenase